MKVYTLPDTKMEPQNDAIKTRSFWALQGVVELRALRFQGLWIQDVGPGFLGGPMGRRVQAEGGSTITYLEVGFRVWGSYHGFPTLSPKP